MTQIGTIIFYDYMEIILVLNIATQKFYCILDFLFFISLDEGDARIKGSE